MLIVIAISSCDSYKSHMFKKVIVVKVVVYMKIAVMVVLE